MINFNQSDIAGSSYERCFHLDIKNIRDSNPVVRFDREEILTLGERVISQPLPSISIEFVPTEYVNERTKETVLPNKDTSILLRDMSTGELTGETQTFEYAYRLLNSLYIQTVLASQAATNA